MLIWKIGEWREFCGLLLVDWGFLLGDGLFEILVCVEGRVCCLDLYFVWLICSCWVFGLSFEVFDFGLVLFLLI